MWWEAETLLTPHATAWSRSMDRVGLRAVITGLLILIAYGPFFASYLPPNFVSPGFRFF